MNFNFVVKDAVNIIGEKERHVFIVSDWTGDEGPHYYQSAILPDTGGMTACQFVAERLLKPGKPGEPGLSIDDLDVALEFLEKGNPPTLVAFVKAYVDQALKALTGERPSEKSKGGVITNQPARDLRETPIRQFDEKPVHVDKSLGSL